MTKNDQLALDLVGQRFTVEFADQLKEHLRDIVEGSKYAGQAWYQQKYAALATLSASQREAVGAVVEEAAAAGLHAILDMFESDKFRPASDRGRLSLLVVDETGSQLDIAEISDGLPGEIYSEEGWLARFSKLK